ncbi:MAG: pyridoxal-phosphate dependent enzyme [Bacteroidetes bacterium]|nr:MAG: pyridoxal-phosphate dependent enzyme [Bacteroidota bacterium]MBL1146019.1 pyridoxal-phosphate dependent enzyme [Bacteroidota bacterium]MCB0802209.1 pyridoxal-phosphate dependent enzyme [Flavobacteriales bacterium]NOG58813.1 pyridoxal-phosphate dependent enzyme [Bacteroidota bacterium]
MKYYNNILETIGNTPLVKFNKITKDVPGLILAKMETFNPGHSIKDRMALKMVEDAEKDGRLKPGGTIIEGTSGNTGMGLALAAIVKGYKLICTLADKQSKEKMDILRAMGAEVIVTPTNVSSDDPRSYYSVAKKLNEEIPNSFYPNQYDNLSNRIAHYEQTGPEIWEQTDGKITHLVVGVGTGGTISGTAKFLKEKNPNIKIWGIDTYGSVFKKYHETGIFDESEIYSYITEGIGEDILPENVDFGLIDHFEKVTDKDGVIMTRRLAREEGFFMGNSAGSAVAGLLQLKDRLKEDDVVVVIFHDHGSRYVGKMFNDDWVRDRGFMDAEKPNAITLVKNHKNKSLITAGPDENLCDVLNKMTQYNISQVPVVENGEYVGSLNDSEVYSKIVSNPELKDEPVKKVMDAPYEFVDGNASLEEIAKKIDKHNRAVLVKNRAGDVHIITIHDIIEAINPKKG